MATVHAFRQFASAITTLERRLTFKPASSLHVRCSVDLGTLPVTISSSSGEMAFKQMLLPVLSPWGSSLAAILAALLSACGDVEQPSNIEAFWTGVEPIEIARGLGERGPWRQNESDFAYVDDPTVALFRDGTAAVAWSDQAHKDIQLQLYTPGGQALLAEPVNVSATPSTFSWLPRLAIAPDNQESVYALWQEIVFSGGSHGGEILFAGSADGGRTFSAPTNLSNSVAGDGKGRLTLKRWDNGSLDLAAAPDGHLYVAWTEYEGRLWVSRSTDAGDTFREPAHVAGHVNRPARGPEIEVGNDGTILLAWSESGNADPGIRIASSIDGGRSFTAPVIVPSSGHADAPKIAEDSRGNLHLVYADSPGGLLGQYQIRYARRDAGSKRFISPTTIAAPPENTASLSFPDVEMGVGDRLYVVWKVFPGIGELSRGLGFTLSNDGGQSFAEEKVVFGSDDHKLGFGGSLQGSLMKRLASNRAGSLVLVGSTFAPGRSSKIWLWRRSPRPN